MMNFESGKVERTFLSVWGVTGGLRVRPTVEFAVLSTVNCKLSTTPYGTYAVHNYVFMK